MESKLEFIINAIIKVSKTDRMEGLEDSKVVTIKGTKGGFLRNDEIKILIKRSSTNPTGFASLTAIINGKSESEDVAKEVVYEILKRAEMLDKKLEMKLDIVFNNKPTDFDGGQSNVDYSAFKNLYHSRLKIEDAELKKEILNPFAAGVVLGYRLHLENCWPEIKNSVEIGFIEGTDGSEIAFSNSSDCENKHWLSFIRVGIALPLALENCKKYEIMKLVIYCNGEVQIFTPDELKNLFIDN